MRRVLLFAAFLLLLGLTTATAASFDVQAEDITSFSTEVSIDVPSRTAPLYLRGGSTVVPGGLLDEEPPNGRVNTKTILPSGARVDVPHASADLYHAWETLGDRTVRISGTISLFINLKDGALTGAILECADDLPDGDERVRVNDIDVTARGLECGVIAVSNRVVGTSGIGEVGLVLNVPATTIEVGNTLRLKIANQWASGGTDAFVQWGWNSARSSQLAFG